MLQNRFFKNAAVFEAVLVGVAGIALLASVSTASAVGRHSPPKSAPVGCVSAPVGGASAPADTRRPPVGCSSAPVRKSKFLFIADVKGKKTVGTTLVVNAKFANKGQAGRYTLVTTVTNGKGATIAEWTTKNVRVGKNDKYVQSSKWKTEGLAAGKFTVSQKVLFEGKVISSDKKTATVKLAKAPKAGHGKR